MTVIVSVPDISNSDRVAFGIMLGFVFNFITTSAPNNDLTLGLVLGAPVVPALLLIGALWQCPESPRYYLRQEKPNYMRAFEALKKLRSKCEVHSFLYYNTSHLIIFFCVVTGV